MKLLDNMHEIKTLLESIETLAESPIGPGLEFFMSYLLIRTLQQNDFNRRDSKSKVTQKTVVNAILFSEDEQQYHHQQQQQHNKLSWMPGCTTILTSTTTTRTRTRTKQAFLDTRINNNIINNNNNFE
jgi:hypothetical protein